MSTPQDNTNTTGRNSPPTESPPDEPRREPGAGGQSAMPPRRTWLWFALILLANFLLFRFLFPGPEAPVEVPYTFFKEQVGASNVEMIYGQGDTVEGRFEQRSPTRRKERAARIPARSLRAPPRTSPPCSRPSSIQGLRSS